MEDVCVYMYIATKTTSIFHGKTDIIWYDSNNVMVQYNKKN